MICYILSCLARVKASSETAHNVRTRQGDKMINAQSGKVVILDDTGNPAREVDKRESTSAQAIADKHAKGKGEANPYKGKAKGEKSGEGKANGPLHAYTKATLCYVAFEMFGKGLDLNGKFVYLSAIPKPEIVQLLTANGVSESDIDLALSEMWETE